MRDSNASPGCLLKDLVASVVVVGLACVGVWFLFGVTHGLPEMNFYYQADVPRIHDNLVNFKSNYFRMSIHPLFGWVCIAYSMGSNLLDLADAEAVRLYAMVVVSLTLLLFMILGRQLGLGTYGAVAVTLLYAASGGVLNWAILPETHLLGACSIMAALVLRNLLMRRWPTMTGSNRVIRDGVLLAIAASMVVTNAIVVLFASWNARFLRKRAVGSLVRLEWMRFPRHLLVVAVGVLVLQVVQMGSFFIISNNTMGRLFNIHGEIAFVVTEQSAGFFDCLLALGVLAPSLEGNGMVAILCGLVVFVIVYVMLREARPAMVPLLLFAIFGVALHVFYGRGDSFLYSANYTWAAMMLVGLFLAGRTGRFFVPVCLLLACGLGYANAVTYIDSMDQLVEAGHIWMPFD